MKTALRAADGRRALARAGLPALALLFCLTFLPPAPARAAGPAPVAPAATARQRPPEVVAAGSMRWLWGPVEWALGNQRRMLQVATVGVCLALWIMMRK
jgi:hypothetical protein